MGCIVILIGLIAGVVSGYFVGWLAFNYHVATSDTGRALFGALGGAIFGGILGTISGDLNRASGSSGSGGSGSRFFLAAISGAIAGAVGGNYKVIGDLFTMLRIPSPF